MKTIKELIKDPNVKDIDMVELIENVDEWVEENTCKTDKTLAYSQVSWVCICGFSDNDGELFFDKQNGAIARKALCEVRESMAIYLYDEHPEIPRIDVVMKDEDYCAECWGVFKTNKLKLIKRWKDLDVEDHLCLECQLKFEEEQK